LSIFRFKHFEVKQAANPLKVGTDSMLLGALIDVSNHKRALDLGAGTGVLSLMIAQKNPTIKINAVEIHSEGHQECCYNFIQSPWSERLTAYHGDYFDFPFVETYDLIFSNPPYFLNALESKSRDLNRAKHSNSTDFFRFFKLVETLLDWDGKCWLILPSEKFKFFISIAAKNDLFPIQIIRIHSKKNKRNIRVIICFSKVKPDEVKIRETTIRNDDGTYSEEYKKLTENYHL
jgi:tRNA1Val (adenine37-N6)-methyltransferase